jgi:hypothetical protein
VSPPAVPSSFIIIRSPSPSPAGPVVLIPLLPVSTPRAVARGCGSGCCGGGSLCPLGVASTCFPPHERLLAVMGVLGWLVLPPRRRPVIAMPGIVVLLVGWRAGAGVVVLCLVVIPPSFLSSSLSPSLSPPLPPHHPVVSILLLLISPSSSVIVFLISLLPLFPPRKQLPAAVGRHALGCTVVVTYIKSINNQNIS